MSRLTTDPSDPGLGRGADTEPVPQNEAYLILSAEERAKGFIRPVRLSYRHLVCGTVTMMSRELAETYARNPQFYGSTYCVECKQHRPVGDHGEFVWVDNINEKVGASKWEDPKPEPKPKITPHAAVKAMNMLMEMLETKGSVSIQLLPGDDLYQVISRKSGDDIIEYESHLRVSKDLVEAIEKTYLAGKSV